MSLFPLHTVLFPGSVLQLKIFEQRYLNLVKTCMRNDHGFVVVLISDGNEVGDTPTIYRIGTHVKITDFETLTSGLLGITITAENKVLIKNTRAQHDGLLVGDIETIIDNDMTEPDAIEKYQHLISMLADLVEHPLLKAQYSNINYQSLAQVSYRLSDFLPTTNINKQELLEISNVEIRLKKIDTLISQLQS